MTKRFNKDELVDLLDKTIGLTLGEVDVNNVFHKTITAPKITGIAGDVLEQSVLGYSADNLQKPDIIVDGILHEVKSTGLKRLKRNNGFVAKEPMTVTAVSPHKIIHEEFLDSQFWGKLENLLLFYYFYDSDTTVVASKYANFEVLGYDFHKFSKEDINTLKNDWTIVRDFIKKLQEDYKYPKEEYHRISSELRSRLMFIDTAPKWPNPPRFRLKRSFVNSIIGGRFDKKTYDKSIKITNASNFDLQLRQLEEKYSGKSVAELFEIFDIEIENYTKSVNERIVVNMFGSKATKINSIDVFNKAGVIAKTISITPKGKRTEDMKLFRIDFEEVVSEIIGYDETMYYDFFANHQILCIIFEEVEKSDKMKNIFKGFKRIVFSEEFINQQALDTWVQIKDLVVNKKLKDVVKMSKGIPVVNKTGVIKSAPNFPKSGENIVFVRGTSSDSTNKPLIINDIPMYQQWVWIKGSYICGLL